MTNERSSRSSGDSFGKGRRKNLIKFRCSYMYKQNKFEIVYEKYICDGT